MTLELRLADLNDERFLTATMTAAFNFDSAFYFGEGQEDGPPGYNDGTLSKKIMQNPALSTYIISDEAVAKGFLTVNAATNELTYFCILPAYINQGVGTQALQALLALYPDIRWQVETPSYSLRNHHFYEKFGFEKYGEKNYGPAAVSFLFRQKQ